MSGGMRTRGCAVVLALLVALAHATTVRAATITVTSTADDTAVNGNCTLREAVRAANLDAAVDACPKGSGADTITLSSKTYRFAIGGQDEDQGLTGDLDVTSAITIQGTGAASTTIDANHLDRAIEVHTDASLTLKKLTLRGGRLGGFEAAGAGVRSDFATLVIEDCDIRDNQSTFDYCYCYFDCGCLRQGIGGGVFAGGYVTIRNSRFLDNQSGSGGAVALASVFSAALENVELASNHAVVGGAAYVVDDTTVTFDGCDIHGNFADLVSGDFQGNAAGVKVSGSMAGSILDVTFQDCSIRDHHTDGPVAALDIYRGTTAESVKVVLRRSQVTDNSASYVGGIDVDDSTLVVEDSVVSGNQSSSMAAVHGEQSDVTIRRSAIVNNVARSSAGLVAHGGGKNVDLINTTLSNNVSTDGSAALYLYDVSSDLRQVTVVGGGCLLDPTPPPKLGSVRVRNSIFVDSCWGDPRVIALTSEGGNLEGPGNVLGFDQPTDVVGVVSPRLGPLADNGGYSPTHALLTGSPAIDGARDDKCEGKDQRSVTRPADGDGDGVPHCDRGAYELTCTGTDADGDGVADVCDNCPATGNPGQEDADGNGAGDACSLFVSGFDSGGLSDWSATLP